MSVDVDNASSPVGQTTYAHLVLESAVVTAPPFTFAIWFNPASLAGSNGATLITVQGLSGLSTLRGYYLYLSFFSDPVPNRVVMQADGVLGSPQKAYSATDYVVDQWQLAGGVVASYSSVKAYLDGVAGTENTSTHSDISAFLGATRIGAFRRSIDSDPFVGPFNGCYGFAYVWDGVALTDEQMALLAAGLPPEQVQQGAQVVALKMLTAATAGDNDAGTDFTVFDPLTRYSDCADEPPLVSGGSSFVRVMG